MRPRPSQAPDLPPLRLPEDQFCRDTAAVGGCSVFVGNIPYTAEAHELQELFSEVGDVCETRFVIDPQLKKFKGFAFVEFFHEAAVHAALAKRNDFEFHGRKLRVEPATKRHSIPTPAAPEPTPRTTPSVASHVESNGEAPGKQQEQQSQKNCLNQFCQLSCRRPVAKADIQYHVKEHEANMKQATVTLHCLPDLPVFAGDLRATNKAAEESAASEAMKTFGPEFEILKEESARLKLEKKEAKKRQSCEDPDQGDQGDAKNANTDSTHEADLSAV
eukprot:TRINITY_DN21118_c0_g1_i2.p1 TRINITY_DN21118_c0_g1~~TRINITY_DN21118_c0_g1_i2.p1  ORF type:complete len:275 (+),score=57.56 TRINITY_DN21118_c0_g1_i2:2-826(+)